MIWRSWLSGAVCGFAMIAGDVVAGEERAADPAKLANLVRQDCGSCHGLTLRGGLGTALTTDKLAQWDADQLTHIILDGIPGTPMPPWRPLLSESEARWIADALKRGTLP
jgi:cytochrome c55X